jgi:hypothetical protein
MKGFENIFDTIQIVYITSLWIPGVGVGGWDDI